MSIYKELQALVDSEPDFVVAECTRLLDENPDDAPALLLLGYVYSMAERFGLAVNVFHRVVSLLPKKPEGWNNLGMAYHGLKDPKALGSFMTAWGLEKKASYAANIGSAYLEQCRWKDALEWSGKALKMEEVKGAHVTHGMASLALGDWKTGWHGFNHALGGKFRKETQFADEGRWDGTKGQTVVVYGEQGLGDEVMYSSCVPDIASDCSVILECDPRLEGLFKRSFPQVTVYGTRRLEADWMAKHQIDARCAIAGLPGFYRNDAKDFPGTPYLVADPERRLQWRALFDSWGKRPRIGIAWSGGSRHNRPKERSMGLEAFRPLIEGMDADFISLQYQDPIDEIREADLPVRHFKRACQTDDYDDTAALVAELDLVISVPTSVVHLAGALGVKTHCLTPPMADWNFHAGLPWYECVELIWKKKETWNEFAKRYAADFHRV